MLSLLDLYGSTAALFGSIIAICRMGRKRVGKAITLGKKRDVDGMALPEVVSSRQSAVGRVFD
jgi:hypothetical protein